MSGRLEVVGGVEKLMGEFREIRVVCNDKRVGGFFRSGWREKGVGMGDAGNAV